MVLRGGGKAVPHIEVCLTTLEFLFSVNVPIALLPGPKDSLDSLQHFT